MGPATNRESRSCAAASPQVWYGRTTAAPRCMACAICQSAKASLAGQVSGMGQAFGAGAGGGTGRCHRALQNGV